MKMSCLFVTAFVLPKDAAPHRDLDTYYKYFQMLVDSKVPLCVFLDERIQVLPPIADHVTIHSVSMKDRWIDSCILPSRRNIQKDTCDYMVIQLSKLWFIEQATNLYPHVNTFAWIDFGVFHMFRDVPVCQEKLRAIASKRVDKIWAPGSWTHGAYAIWDSVCWRFCGSFFVGPRQLLVDAYAQQCKLVNENLPKLTWEVNYWTLMEEYFTWYPGDHCDLLLNIPV